MVYLGKGFAAADEDWMEEPALIIPDLALDRRYPDRTGADLPYWPSYRDLSPAARAGYLEWSAGGRKALEAPIGFVFLFFYGLERRLLADPVVATISPEEIKGLRSEVQRLLNLYGDNDSFSRYATSLLQFTAPDPGSQKGAADRSPSSQAAFSDGLPTDLALTLAQLAVDGEPIAADWALSWVCATGTIALRTPARRCGDLFQALFRIRYHERFGEGLKIRPNKTRLVLKHQPASRGLHLRTRKLDLPDISRLSAPVRKLADLVDFVTDELDAYSRWLYRHEEGESTLPGLALLPTELLAEAKDSNLEELQEWLEEVLAGDQVVFSGPRDLTSRWPTKHPDRMLKKEVTNLAQLLEKLGVGLEPDVRFGGPTLKAEAPVVLFRRPRKTSEALSREYANATLLLHLAAAVAAADGEIGAAEEEYLEEQIERALELSPGEALRLRGHLAWLLAAPPGFAGLKKRLDGLTEKHRRSLAALCIAVAGADGRIDPGEIKILEKIYRLLGLEKADVFSDLHQLGAQGGPADAPVTVRHGQPAAPGFALPSKPEPELEPESTGAGGFTLDRERVRQRMQESQESSRLLAEIFREEDLEPAAPASITPSPAAVEETLSAVGLDSAHHSLLQDLPRAEELALADFERLADERGLLPNGALDVLNEAALDFCDEPLLEGEDPLEINLDVLKEMLE